MESNMLTTIDDQVLESVSGGGIGSDIGAALGGILDGTVSLFSNLIGSGIAGVGHVLTGLGGILSGFGPKK